MPRIYGGILQKKYVGVTKMYEVESERPDSNRRLAFTAHAPSRRRDVLSAAGILPPGSYKANKAKYEKQFILFEASATRPFGSILF